jgi:hypothetical protein
MVAVFYKFTPSGLLVLAILAFFLPQSQEYLQGYDFRGKIEKHLYMRIFSWKGIDR